MARSLAFDDEKPKLLGIWLRTPRKLKACSTPQRGRNGEKRACADV